MYLFSLHPAANVSRPNSVRHRSVHKTIHVTCIVLRIQLYIYMVDLKWLYELVYTAKLSRIRHKVSRKQKQKEVKLNVRGVYRNALCACMNV